MAAAWLERLKRIVEKKPMVVLTFSDREWEDLHNSRRGLNAFTVARPHALLANLKVPTPCLMYDRDDGDASVYFGLIRSRSAITTLESRLKITRGIRIAPNSREQLASLVTKRPHAGNLQSRLQSDLPVVHLSPKLSSYLIERLASIEGNHGALRSVSDSLSIPTQFKGNEGLQEDAVRTALAAFGMSSNEQARDLQLVSGQSTALSRINIMEDSVIEHDARAIPRFDLVRSDITGRAVFEKGNERLIVFTANRRPLEQCLGVDLIYLNVSRRNIVMLQYKMLEPEAVDRTETDWIYRPDAQLEAEICRMQRFAVANQPRPHEYRLNPAVFFLKFVKRDGLISNGGLIMPLDHFDTLRTDPTCRGPKDGLRISYKSLNGRYLRQVAFLDLIRSGYIGAYSETTANLQALIEAILDGNRAVVAAIHESQSEK